MTSGSRVVGVVLAAGGSTRMGGPKALATLDGESFVGRAIHSLRRGGCARVIVVVAEPHGRAIEVAIAGAFGGDDAVHVAWNPAPADGQLGSLRVALRAAGEPWDAAVVALVDHPRVSHLTVEALIREHDRARVEVVRPRRAGRHGHPYLIDRALFPALLGADLTGGARPVLEAATTSASVDVDDSAIHDDVDTEEDARACGAIPHRNES